MDRRSLTRNIAIEATRTNDLESGEIPLHLTRTVRAPTRSSGHRTRIHIQIYLCGHSFCIIERRLPKKRLHDAHAAHAAPSSAPKSIAAQDASNK